MRGFGGGDNEQGVRGRGGSLFCFVGRGMSSSPSPSPSFFLAKMNRFQSNRTDVPIIQPNPIRSDLILSKSSALI